MLSEQASSTGLLSATRCPFPLKNAYQRVQRSPEPAFSGCLGAVVGRPLDSNPRPATIGSQAHARHATRSRQRDSGWQTNLSINASRHAHSQFHGIPDDARIGAVGHASFSNSPIGTTTFRRSEAHESHRSACSRSSGLTDPSRRRCSTAFTNSTLRWCLAHRTAAVRRRRRPNVSLSRCCWARRFFSS